MIQEKQVVTSILLELKTISSNESENFSSYHDSRFAEIHGKQHICSDNTVDEGYKLAIYL